MNSRDMLLQRLADSSHDRNAPYLLQDAGRGALIGSILAATFLVGFELTVRFAPHLFTDLSEAAYRGIVFGVTPASAVIGAVVGGGIGLLSARVEAEAASSAGLSLDEAEAVDGYLSNEDSDDEERALFSRSLSR